MFWPTITYLLVVNLTIYSTRVSSLFVCHTRHLLQRQRAEAACVVLASGNLSDPYALPGGNQGLDQFGQVGTTPLHQARQYERADHLWSSVCMCVMTDSSGSEGMLLQIPLCCMCSYGDLSLS
jgi:hypothetical protein